MDNSGLNDLVARSDFWYRVAHLLDLNPILAHNTRMILTITWLIENADKEKFDKHKNEVSDVYG